MCLTEKAAGELAAEHGKPDSIGFTGQMHGMLFVDINGNAVSPLYTWQDGSGNEKFDNEHTYAEILREKVGAAATGYGMTTHFYLCHQNKIPDNAVKMTTISDYLAMKFCGRNEPVLAKDMALTWKKGDF